MKLKALIAPPSGAPDPVTIEDALALAAKNPHIMFMDNAGRRLVPHKARRDGGSRAHFEYHPTDYWALDLTRPRN